MVDLQPMVAAALLVQLDVEVRPLADWLRTLTAYLMCLGTGSIALVAEHWSLAQLQSSDVYPQANCLSLRSLAAWLSPQVDKLTLLDAYLKSLDAGLRTESA